MDASLPEAASDERFARIFADSVTAALREMRNELLITAGQHAKQAVRADPRTEELKVVKADLEEVRKHYSAMLAALQKSNEEAVKEHAINMRILEDLAAVKKSTTDIDRVEKSVKVVTTRLNALDGRIALIENK
jgi:valyl-tRNA synthetase